MTNEQTKIFLYILNGTCFDIYIRQNHIKCLDDQDMKRRKKDEEKSDEETADG